MRINRFVVLLITIFFAASPLQAGAVLGFGLANTQNMAVDPNSDLGDGVTKTTYALGDLSFGVKLGTTNGATIGTSASNQFLMTVDTDYVLQIQMVDTASFTFPN